LLVDGVLLIVVCYKGIILYWFVEIGMVVLGL
jgi:hypothetical protein